MRKKDPLKTVISPFGLGSFYSYELHPDRIITLLFGVIPVHTIYLSEIYYLRPATLKELAKGMVPLHGLNIIPDRKPVLPMYVLQTKTRRLVLNLQKGTLFTLNQAIERSKISRRRALAS